MSTPPLPAGYAIDQQQGPPPLPPGYTLDSAPSKAPAVDPLDPERPLDSPLSATVQGLNRVGQGAVNAVKGAVNTVMHPIDTATSLYHAPGRLIEQAKQVPAAIHDINESPDPTGAYLQAAGRTAGEAGGQAIATAGMMKAPSMAADVNLADVGPKAAALGKVGAQEAVSHIPVVGRVVRRPSFGDWADAAQAKAPAVEVPPANDGLTPIQRAWVARGGKLSDHQINHGNPVPFRERPPAPVGETIHVQPDAPAVAPEVAPAPKPAVNVKPAKVGELLNDSLGGRPLQPNVPLRQQMTAKPPAAVTVPSGHTAVESSAIKSYSYDPASREFQSVTPSGATYIHGDVSPEQVEAFEAAQSKGKAFNQLKQNSTLVGKVINGQRVNVQPPRALGSASPEVATPTKAPAVGEDLTPILQKSLEAARKRKR